MHVKHKQDICSNHYQLDFAFANKLETTLKYFYKQSKKDESIEEKKCWNQKVSKFLF